MTTVIVVAVPALLGLLLSVELLRWTFRPEARRLRVIKKIGGRR